MKPVLRTAVLLAAAASLALLGWSLRPPLSRPPSPAAEATLWTEGAGGAATAGHGVAESGTPWSLRSHAATGSGESPLSRPNGFDTGLHLALPDADPVPAGVRVIPDTAFLRRSFPALRRLRIEGDGVEPAAAAVLSGLAVEWRRPAVAPARSPKLSALTFSRRLLVGEHLVVQGAVQGLRPGDSVPLVLTGPDGTPASVELHAPADASGDSPFTLRSTAPAVTAGLFEWTLRLGATAGPLPLGVAVEEPDLPRVLVLQAAPEPEGARLQRWLASVGARVTARTRVSADHWRHAAANGSPPEVATLEADALDGFDVVVARDDALAALTAAERESLRGAVATAGVGLLLYGDPAAEAAWPALAALRLVPDATGDADTGPRLTRLRLHTGAELPEPAPVFAAELTPPATGRTLARDPQGRPIAAALPLGRGWVARSLVLESWRWNQSGHPADFSRYWSALLSAVARPASGRRESWIVEPATTPIFVGEPVRLAWLGAADPPPPAAEVRLVREAEAAPVPLPLARDPTEPTVARAIFRPARPGWHEARILPAGATLAFHVLPAAALPGVRAAAARAATERLVQGAPPVSWKPDTVTAPAAGARLLAPLGFMVFLAAASALWLDERRR